MEEITPTQKTFREVTKTFKSEGLRRPDNTVTLNDAEIVNYIVNSIESQRSYASSPHDVEHTQRIERVSLEPKDILPPVSLSEDQILHTNFKIITASGLDGISNKAIKHFPLSLLDLLIAIFNGVPQDLLRPSLLQKDESNRHP
ncbi:hypothetical protein EVAR_59425_1 [Eumeta japonica]|uniref:Uncharacterized protein n=1 Tax=Eumeta variegata TaxID=151549 RepID=A0A4C1Z2P7_EUMVA|nr:hypothetical protein EVAR_59425_1 [Eumeta japonica]